MTTRSVALLAVLAVVGLTIAPVASGAAAVGVTQEGDGANESTPETTVSTFMQASSADVASTVDAEMFEARYEAADNDSRPDLVIDRTGDLEGQLETLEAEREELRDREDELHRGEYRSRMTQLTVEIRSLEREIDRTEQRAEETGVDSERLEELRSNARNLSGPEVAEIARGLGVNGTPGNGPPEDRGNSNANRGNGQGNPDAGPPDRDSKNATAPGRGNGVGPGNENGNGGDSTPGNGPDKRADRKSGSPIDSGNGSGSGGGSGNGAGNGNDAGNGNGSGNGGGSGNGAGNGNGSGSIDGTQSA